MTMSYWMQRKCQQSQTHTTPQNGRHSKVHYFVELCYNSDTVIPFILRRYLTGGCQKNCLRQCIPSDKGTDTFMRTPIQHIQIPTYHLHRDGIGSGRTGKEC
jgi:hypothetical protein